MKKYRHTSYHLDFISCPILLPIILNNITQQWSGGSPISFELFYDSELALNN